MGTVGLGDVALVGRGRELALMVKSLSSHDKPSFVIAGPAGVGKSRLAAEVARQAGGSGYSTAHVFATAAAATIPFGAFAPLLPEMKPMAAGLVGVLHSACDVLLERADDKDLLLVVDDAQLLDDGSATLVHQLASHASCSLVASVRTPGRMPDPITNLWKDGIAERIDLGAFDEREVEQLARTLLGGPATGPAVRWLFDTSKGNPLFIRELVRGALERGTLTEDHGVWSVHLPWEAPERLVELVTERIGELSPATREVVDLLALGEPLGIDLVEQIAGPDALEDAERAGIAVVREAGRRASAGLVHPLYAEVLRQRMGRLRKMRLSGLLAQVVVKTEMRRHDDVLRVARWQLDARADPDVDLLTRATMRAKAMYDFGLVTRIGRAALDAGAGPLVGKTVGEALFSTGHHREAEELLLVEAGRCETDDERSAIARARVYNFGTLIGDQDRAMACADEALASITDPDARLMLQSQVAVTRVTTGDFSGALEGARELLASADEDIRLRGGYIASWALAMLGSSSEAIEIGMAAHAVQRRQELLPMRQLVGVVLALASAGRMAEADDAVKELYDGAVSLGDPDTFSTAYALGGWVRVDIGRLGEAAHSFRAGAALTREAKDMMMLRMCLGGLMIAEGNAGNAAEAGAAEAELDAMDRHWARAFDGDLIDRGRAWVRAAAGETTTARALLRSAASAAADAVIR